MYYFYHCLLHMVQCFFGCELIKLKLYFFGLVLFRVVYSVYNSMSKPFSMVGDTLFRALLLTIVYIVVINSIFLDWETLYKNSYLT